MVGPGMGSARSNREASSDWREVLSAKQFRQAGDLDAAARRVTQQGACADQVILRVGRAAHLDQAHGERTRLWVHGVGLGLTEIGAIGASRESILPIASRLGEEIAERLVRMRRHLKGSSDQGNSYVPRLI